MEYLIIEAREPAEMAVKINKAIASGWKPQGGIAAYTVMTRNGNGGSWYEIWFMQAIVKEIGK
jgi:hypothetical protein